MQAKHPQRHRSDWGNGHRRRELTTRVKAEETHCALCGNPVDKTLRYLPGEHGPKCSRTDCTGCIPHPMSGEVDEDLPRSRGGSPLDRDNVALMHRICNQRKGKMTLTEAKNKLTVHSTVQTYASPGW